MRGNSEKVEVPLAGVASVGQATRKPEFIVDMD